MTVDDFIIECLRLCERGTKPTRDEVIKLTTEWYTWPGNGAGGALHVVLDDHNYERKFIRSVMNGERNGEPVKSELYWLCRVLLLLSNSQRRRGV